MVDRESVDGRTLMLKKALLLAVSFLLAFAVVGCGSAQSSKPEQIDVVGLSLKEAYSELSEEGWSVTTADDDAQSSGYIPGSYENGDEQYADKPVIRVEFKAPKSGDRGYEANYSCTVVFKSGSEAQLEETYDQYYEMYREFYDESVELIANEGATDEVLSRIFPVFELVLLFDPDDIPASRVDRHTQLVHDYADLLGIPYEEPDTPTKSNNPSDSISWEEAHAHVGETVSVRGAIVDWAYRGESNGTPTYLDMGAAYPNKSRVTLVIWKEDRGAFSNIENGTDYLGKTVCVTGEIYEYDGVCYIKVESPSQIEVTE